MSCSDFGDCEDIFRKDSYLIGLDHQHSKTAFQFIFLPATLEDILITKNIADTLKDTKR